MPRGMVELGREAGAPRAVERVEFDRLLHSAVLMGGGDER
jgi:hypothetical protein